MNSRRVAGRVVAWMALVLGCTSRQDIPPPVLPFTLTPAEPYRERPPALEAARELVAPEPKSFELENGMRVIVVERHDIPVVSLAFANRAARDGDAVAKVGLAALTAHTLDAGTLLPNGKEREELRIDGRSLRLVTTPDGTSVQVETLAWGVDDELAVLARWARFPALDENAFSHARLILTDQVRKHEKNFLTHLRKAALERLYGTGRALTVPPTGTHDNLANLGLADVKGFYQRSFRPGASALIVVGDVNANEVFERARTHFGDWASSGRAGVYEPVPVIARYDELEILGIMAGPQQAVVVGVFPCPGHADPDAFAGDLLAMVLGKITLSRTAVRLRHQTGASYAGSAECIQRRHFGELTVVLTSNTERAGMAVETMLGQIRSLKTDVVSKRELETAKGRLIALYTSQLASTPSLARVLSSNFLSGIPDDFFTTLTERVRSVTAEQLREVASRYFAENRFAIAVGGDIRALQPQLNDFGKVRWTRVEENSK